MQRFEEQHWTNSLMLLLDIYLREDVEPLFVIDEILHEEYL